MTIDLCWLGGTGYGAAPDLISETFHQSLDKDRFRWQT